MVVVLSPAYASVTWPWVYMSQYFNPDKELPLRTRILEKGTWQGSCHTRTIASAFYGYTRSAEARETVKRRFLTANICEGILPARYGFGWPGLEV
jgi:hypothetical protein